ncbi:MAG: non-oxidative hydroxyarylic acid decarboxylases subunit D [Moorellaceae bacterium]
MICPRCDSDTAEKMVSSPVGNVWEVYVCRKCWFSWRSTEDTSITDPAKYNKKFKLTDEMIQNMMVIPPIPPLKETGGK